MGLISALGLDATIGYQFVIFLVTYLFLYFLVFKPYYRAFLKRTELTTGNQDVAEQLTAEAEQLKAQYETKARAINQQFKSIYDQSRLEAVREQERLIQESRKKAQELLENARGQIKAQVEMARAELQSKTPEVTNAIMSKVLGKEITL